MKHILYVTLIAISISGRAMADEDYPRITMLHHTTERSGLQIECHQQKDGTLDCSFLQTAVRKEAKKSELESTFDKNVSDALRGLQEKKSRKDCDEASDIYAALLSGTPPKSTKDPDKFFKVISQLKPREKKDLQNQIGAYKEVSCNPNKQSVEKMIRLSNDKRLRTCRVSVFEFNQSFTRDINTGNWVSTSAPDGPCGKIHIGTFIKEKTTSLGITLWNYITKKVVTNKSGEDIIGSCKNWDEEEYTYSWKSKEWFMGCDYIKFTPL